AGPKLPFYLEEGLRLGFSVIYREVKRMNNLPEQADRPGTRPKISLVKEFLINNGYVVTNTDKNLGLCVSRVEWIKEKSLDILNDTNNYREVSLLEVNYKLDLLCKRMKMLAADAEQYLPEGIQLGKFLRSKISKPLTEN